MSSRRVGVIAIAAIGAIASSNFSPIAPTGAVATSERFAEAKFGWPLDAGSPEGAVQIEGSRSGPKVDRPVSDLAPASAGHESIVIALPVVDATAGP